MTFSKSTFLKLVLLLFVAIMSVISCNKKKQETVITGTIEGVKDRWVYVVRHDVPRMLSTVVDSFYVENENFMMSLEVDKMLHLGLAFINNISRRNSQPFFVSEGERVNLEVKFDAFATNQLGNINITGSKINDEIIVNEKQNKEIRTQEEIEKYVLANLNSQLSSIYLLDLLILEGNHGIEKGRVGAKALYNWVSNDVKDSYYGKQLSQRILANDNSLIGGKAFNFIMQDTSGQKFALYDIDSKYTILKFWLSMDEDYDRHEFHKLKFLYDKYHDKGLEIVCVALTHPTLSWINKTGEQLWLENISERGIGEWINIMEPFSENSIYGQFDLKSVEATFLLDEEGTILRRIEESANHHGFKNGSIFYTGKSLSQPDEGEYLRAEAGNLDDLIAYVETLF